MDAVIFAYVHLHSIKIGTQHIQCKLVLRLEVLSSIGNMCPGTEIEKLLKNFLNIALKKRGYDVLTPVQQEVSKPELETSDLLVSAQTG